ncbi:hypothetical protein [Peribacillus butanolivorans]|uniref:hypothetical protein n=1 Tax=Peribacillus butanolivorans TaxID=421767 RepID=UPI00167F26F7|nr:hypothetical protein [Peribacillus butanolivorans]QNU06074.1 hypothetical protein GM240_20640 [Peribacillus butanolivorans]
MNNNFEESSSEESGNMVEAITTGVFHVPVDNQAPDSNDMINIYFKNPSSKTLTANFLVEFSSPGVAPGVQNPEISSPPNGNWTVTVLPHHTLLIVVTGPASPPAFGTWRFSFWGDIDRNEKKNKLSVEVIAGRIFGSGPDLAFDDAGAAFPHGLFVDADIEVTGPSVPVPTGGIISV